MMYGFKTLGFLVLCLVAFLEVKLVKEIGYHSANDWTIFLLFLVLGAIWLFYHIIFYLVHWKLLSKVLKWNSRPRLVGTSYSSFLASEGIRYFALSCRGIILVSFVTTTLLVFTVGSEAPNPYYAKDLVCLIEAVTFMLFWNLGDNLGGSVSGYGIIAPVTSRNGTTQLTLSGMEANEKKASTTFISLQQFFSHNTITNFDTERFTRELEKDSLMTKLSSFFDSTTPDGRRFDTYLLYFSGDVHQNGDWVLADNHYLSLSMLLQWWKEMRARSGSRLLLVLDCSYSYQWLSSLVRNTNDFVAIQTCRYITQSDPETGGNTCSVGDFTRAFTQFNTEQDVTIDWHSSSRPVQALYQVSRRWTNFTLPSPTRKEIREYLSSELPWGIRWIIKRLPICSCTSSQGCFQRVGQWYRSFMMHYFPPKHLDTGHGFQLINS